MSIPSSLDPTLAPEGCHVASLFTQYTPYNLKFSLEGWTREMKLEYTNLGKQEREREREGERGGGIAQYNLNYMFCV